MNEITKHFMERGDLAHLALFLWATGASALLLWTLRELAAANRRFDGFVRELARFNRRLGGNLWKSDESRLAIVPVSKKLRHGAATPHTIRNRFFVDS